MSRVYLVFFVSLVTAICFHASVQAQTPSSNATDDVVAHVTTPTDDGTSSDFTISFTCSDSHHLFVSEHAIDLQATIQYTGVATNAEVKVLVSSATGTVISSRSLYLDFPKQNDIAIPIILDKSLPKGCYLIEIFIFIKDQIDWKHAATTVTIWDGPAMIRNQSFGISYAGSLTDERAWRDLDAFKLAGIGWVRFPFLGWIPQGEATPAAAEMYDRFMREATDRGFSLLPAFTPQISTDPAVNPVQAEKDFYESLLAATTRYGFKMHTWEFQKIIPPTKPTGMRGISYGDIAKARAAMRKENKTLTAILPLETPMSTNALEMFFYRLPAKKDLIGIHYNFDSIPEFKNPISPAPTFERENIYKTAMKSLKYAPKIWVTETGFNPPKQRPQLPPVALQAALMSRAYILNRAMGFEKTFWRHNPANSYETPFTNADGSWQPTLFALYNTMKEMNNVTSIINFPIKESSTSTLHAFIFVIADGGKKSKPHYRLAVWSERDVTRKALVLTTSALHVTVRDLWGNAIELQPINNTAVVQSDEYPRFIDIGNDKNPELRLASGIVEFEKAILVVSTVENEYTGKLALRNNQVFFKGEMSGEVSFSLWPSENEAVVKTFSLAPYMHDIFEIPITIPESATGNLKSGREICELNADITIQGRRFGRITMPIYYYPMQQKGEDSPFSLLQ